MRIGRPSLGWFLPDDPDVLAALREQMAITVRGMEAFAQWASGTADADGGVGDIEHEADEAKRAVRRSLRDAFITPLSPEDLFTLSQQLDKVLTDCKDVVRESEVMAMRPDAPMAEMAELLREGTAHLSEAFKAFGEGGGGKDDHATATATDAADAATKSARHMEKVYRQAMSGLLELDDDSADPHARMNEIMGRRELYRRLSRIADTLVDVADRVWYAAVKES
jgi:uncharacterized protein Yka (UPF0111/DUF47 family)